MAGGGAVGGAHGEAAGGAVGAVDDFFREELPSPGEGAADGVEEAGHAEALHAGIDEMGADG